MDRIRNALLAADGKYLRSALYRRSATLLREIIENDHAITHELLDTLGSVTRTRALRAFLIRVGVLEARDEQLAHLVRAVHKLADQIENPNDRRTFIRFATWRHLRRAREAGEFREGQGIASRQELALVVQLIEFAQSRRGTFREMDQTTLDRWLEDNPGRHRVRPFIMWATRQHVCGLLRVPSRVRADLIVTSVPETANSDQLQTILQNAALDAGTKLAAALVLVFGVLPRRIVHLKRSSIAVTAIDVTISLGPDPLQLPPQLAAIACEAARLYRPSKVFGITSDGSDWLYPGMGANTHLTPDALRARLRLLGVRPETARKTALRALSQQLPPIVTARLTGIHVGTAIRWAGAVSATNARYAALLADEFNAND